MGLLTRTAWHLGASDMRMVRIEGGIRLAFRPAYRSMRLALGVSSSSPTYGADKSFLHALQLVHDEYEVRDWRMQIENLALEWRLKCPRDV